MNEADVEIHPWGEVTTLESGQLLRHHAQYACLGPCCLHGTSTHSVCRFPRQWRSDSRILEHVCQHGIGHPCPGSMGTIHGCDGCCVVVD